MRFLVVGHVVHKYQNGSYYAYGPYVREMNLWFKYVDKVIIVAPLNKEIDPDPIDLPYEHDQVMFFPVPEFSTQSVKKYFLYAFSLTRNFLDCNNCHAVGRPYSFTLSWKHGLNWGFGAVFL